MLLGTTTPRRLKDNNNKQPITDIRASKTSTAANANHDNYSHAPTLLPWFTSKIDKAFNRIYAPLDLKLTTLSDSKEKLVSDARALGNCVKSPEKSHASHGQSLAP